MSGFFNIVRGGKKVLETIKSVKPNIPTTKLEKAKSKLNIAIQKTKASQAKLKQTLSEVKTGEYKESGFTFGEAKKNVTKKSKKKD